MQKARSPSYPAIGLTEAVLKVGEVYKNDYQNSIPRALVAQHIGYQGLNGKSLGVLSALIKFGLLEGRGDETRVSDLAVQIIAHPSGTPERAKALAEAAAKPELFKELDNRFPGKASDQALRSFLMTQKFIPSAADSAIRAYRDTKAFVEAEKGSFETDEDSDTNPAVIGSATPQPVHASSSMPPASPSSELKGKDPYKLTYSPSVGIEGNFRLTNVEDVDALIRALNGFKVLLTPI